MDEEINKLRARLEELERQKREEDEKNKDPFRYLRQRIERREQQISHLEEQIQNPGKLNKQQYHDMLASVIAENECDRCIIQAIESLQTEVRELRKQLTDDRESVNVSVVDLLVV